MAHRTSSARAKAERYEERILEHLKRTVRREGWTLGRASTELLGRSPDYLSRIVRGTRPLRVLDLLVVLEALRVPPVAFFAQVDSPPDNLLDLVPPADRDRLREALATLIREAVDEALSS